MRHGLVAEGVQDVAFGSYGGSLDLLLGVAGDEEESGALPVGAIDGDGGAGEFEWPGGGCVYSGGGRAGIAFLGDTGDWRGSADGAISEATGRCGGEVGDGGG